MHRAKILFIGRVGFYPYDFTAIIASIIGIFLATIRIDGDWINPIQAIIILIVVIYASMISGRLSYDLFVRKGPKDLPCLLKNAFRYRTSGGAVSFGGLAGGVLALIMLCRILGIPVGRFLDLITPSIALAFVIVRIGCFFNGCCYGIPTKLPWAVKFDDGLLRHPTQAYSSLANLVIFALLLVVEGVKPFNGFLFLLFLFLYSIQRFMIESLRHQYQKKLLGGILTAAQLVCLIMASTALITFLILNR